MFWECNAGLGVFAESEVLGKVKAGVRLANQSPTAPTAELDPCPVSRQDLKSLGSGNLHAHCFRYLFVALGLNVDIRSL